MYHESLYSAVSKTYLSGVKLFFKNGQQISHYKHNHLFYKNIMWYVSCHLKLLRTIFKKLFLKDASFSATTNFWEAPDRAGKNLGPLHQV